MISIRAAVDADVPALRSLLDQRDGARYATEAVRRHYDGLDPARVRCVVAEVDGRVVGTSTVVLRELVRGSRATRAAYWTDLYVDADHRRQMLYLPLARATLEAGREAGAEITYTANRRPEVYRAHQKLGFRIAGVMTTRVRPVRPLGFVARLAAGPRAAGLLAPVDAMLVAGLGRFEGRTLRADPGVRIDAGEASDERVSRLLPLLVRANRGSLAQRLSTEALVRRYRTPLDGRAYSVLVASRGTDDVGAAVIRTARRGAIEATVVIDLVDGGDRSVAHALVAAIEARAAHEGTDLVLVLDGCPDLDGLWEGLGYRTTPEHYVLLVAPAERAVDPVFGVGSSWRFAFADHDAF